MRQEPGSRWSSTACPWTSASGSGCGAAPEITPGDLEAARDILRSACWASDIRVVVNDRRSHIVVLEVIRRLPPEPPATGMSGWPYRDHGESGDAEPEEPASYHGLGSHRPFG